MGWSNFLPHRTLTFCSTPSRLPIRWREAKSCPPLCTTETDDKLWALYWINLKLQGVHCDEAKHGRKFEINIILSPKILKKNKWKKKSNHCFAQQKAKSESSTNGAGALHFTQSPWPYLTFVFIPLPSLLPVPRALKARFCSVLCPATSASSSLQIPQHRILSQMAWARLPLRNGGPKCLSFPRSWRRERTRRPSRKSFSTPSLLSIAGLRLPPKTRRESIRFGFISQELLPWNLFPSHFISRWSDRSQARSSKPEKGTTQISFAEWKMGAYIHHFTINSAD